MEQTRRIILTCAVAAFGALATTACDDGGGGGDTCTRDVQSMQAVSLGSTSTCGPEPIDETVSTSTVGTLLSVQYHVLVMACGGTVHVDLEETGSRLVLTERVEGGGECGCFEEFLMSVTVEACEPGTYTLVVDGEEHEVTL